MTRRARFDITTRQDLSCFASQLARCIQPGMVFYLYGELGSGKTTFVQSLAAAMGCQEVLRSPTYSLLEVYDLHAYTIIHMDLYRVADDIELEALGLRDYMESPTLWLIEWPQRVSHGLPQSTVDLWFQLESGASKRFIEVAESECNKLGLKAC